MGRFGSRQAEQLFHGERRRFRVPPSKQVAGVFVQGPAGGRVHGTGKKDPQTGFSGHSADAGGYGRVGQERFVQNQAVQSQFMQPPEINTSRISRFARFKIAVVADNCICNQRS